MEYIKSPLNYIGNKYRIISQIQRYFPSEIDNMVDLFCGGCDVTINTKAKKHYANDINLYLIQILEQFKKLGADKTIAYIEKTIREKYLTKENEQAYIDFRNEYNASENKNPLDLYILVCYSFNYQFRFNSSREFNNPFGRARSSFNEVMRSNLVKMIRRLENIEFSSNDFIFFDFSFLGKGDFVYADPPYLLTCGSYNDGKRGFRGWGSNDEITLYQILDKLTRGGINIALSNVLLHKGKINYILLDWIKKNAYHTYLIEFDYNNCNYQAKNRNNQTIEILVTNYAVARQYQKSLFEDDRFIANQDDFEKIEQLLSTYQTSLSSSSNSLNIRRYCSEDISDKTTLLDWCK